MKKRFSERGTCESIDWSGTSRIATFGLRRWRDRLLPQKPVIAVSHGGSSDRQARLRFAML